MNTEEKNDFIISSLHEKLLSSQEEIERLTNDCSRLRDDMEWHKKQLIKEREKTREALGVSLSIFRALFPYENFVFTPSPELKRMMDSRYHSYEDTYEQRRKEEIEQFQKSIPKVVDYVRQFGNIKEKSRLSSLLILLMLGKRKNV